VNLRQGIEKTLSAGGPQQEKSVFEGETKMKRLLMLILGISDEISQIGEIEKVEAISELVDKICGLVE